MLLYIPPGPTNFWLFRFRPQCHIFLSFKPANFHKISFKPMEVVNYFIKARELLSIQFCLKLLKLKAKALGELILSYLLARENLLFPENWYFPKCLIHMYFLGARLFINLDKNIGAFEYLLCTYLWSFEHSPQISIIFTILSTLSW